jgi:hypothetical protein
VHCTVQVGERIQLHRPATPGALDPRAQLDREARGLSDVSGNDFLIDENLIHVRDPMNVRSKKAFQVSGSTRKAGSRHRFLVS